MSYDWLPHYAPVGGSVLVGWDAVVGSLGRFGQVVAIDGPAVLDWAGLRRGLGESFARRDQPVEFIDTRDWFAAWPEILSRTESRSLLEDPDFAPIPEATLSQFFDALPRVSDSPAGATVVYGPGSALVEHEVLWYADLPKRYAEEAVGRSEATNLGAPQEIPPTSRRLLFVDWPVLDRHRDAISPRIDLYVDTQSPEEPHALDGWTLRHTSAELARRPFRTRPTFNSLPWGGHWAQRELHVREEARNSALGYELIAPEAGVLIGESAAVAVEVPLQLLVAQFPSSTLGSRVHEIFGTSFPIRFDYLDTLDGGNLSVHCHPQPSYMRSVFGYPYPEHESYYVMVGSKQNRVFLGLKGDVDVSGFERDARLADTRGVSFDIHRYVQSHPAEPHGLFMIPAGTPHGSGAGNVVLEISATPYLYSLRFYDWLRQDIDGSQRPVHVSHAFANLNRNLSGPSVRQELIQEPRSLSSGPGWREELLGRLPGVFFEVRRLVLEGGAAPSDTGAGVHVLNVVEGSAALVETSGGEFPVNYAETIIVPSGVGPYRVRPLDTERVRVVKALVR